MVFAVEGDYGLTGRFMTTICRNLGCIGLVFLLGHDTTSQAVRPCDKPRIGNKAAGGDVSYALFEGSVHEWVAEPGPQTTRAQEIVKAFIARQLAAGRRAA